MTHRLANTDNAFEAIHNTMVFSSNDWGAASDFAWLYGIAVGWDDDPDDPPELRHNSMEHCAEQFGWSDEAVARLRRLHLQFQAARP